MQVESLITKEEDVQRISLIATLKSPATHGMTKHLERLLPTQLEKGPERDDQKRHMATRPLPLAWMAKQSAFKTPLLDSTVLPQSDSRKITPRHDTDAPNALVMKRTMNVPRGKEVVDVVVDPVLSKHLRAHQREGVQFMYECVMGMRPYSGEGTILADEMGLGKTLQVIALLWTLMKQNPVHGEQPVVKKALIVAPVTLIKNWRKEIRKWLGSERIGVLVVEDSKTRITDFTMGKSYNIMIVGYEKLRTIAPELRKAASGIDIVIADEGHRLKTAANKSAQAIKAFATTRRIILTGTPMQNELSEFYFMVDFVNPGLLGKYNTFKKEFETPIMKSRQPEATALEKEKGQARSEELKKLTSLFIIRRSAELLDKYLPPKAEYVLFCRPTSTQSSVYRSILKSSAFVAAMKAPETTLQLITILRKVCSSPSLVSTGDETGDGQTLSSSIVASIPHPLLKSAGASGKLQVLDSLLYHIRMTTKEKVVIVSHWTATLEVIGNLLSSLDYPFLRLDGSTPQSKRQELVEKFNRTDASTSFAFLLSAKAGGVGLNLVGASRLILFDNDWNPSTDIQAMARIHRDGQRRPCRIYRLLTQGTLDEKIFQRQATKLSLSDSVVDGKVSFSSFTYEELRDLFRLDESNECQTHDLLGCLCNGHGSFKPVAIAVSPTESGNDEDVVNLNPSIQLSQKAFVEESNEHKNLESRADIAKMGVTDGQSMLSLMQYRHFDTKSLVPQRTKVDKANIQNVDAEADIGEALLDDEVLMSVLKDTENRVNFVFAKGAV